jgi:hypothetical protein
LNLPTSSGPPKDVVDSARSLRAAKRQPGVEIPTLVEQPHEPFDGEFVPITEVVTEFSVATEKSGIIDAFVAGPNLSSAASQTKFENNFPISTFEKDIEEPFLFLGIIKFRHNRDNLVDTAIHVNNWFQLNLTVLNRLSPLLSDVGACQKWKNSSSESCNELNY